MTTISGYRGYHEVVFRLRQVGSRLGAVKAMESVLAMVAAIAGAVWTTTMLQGFLRFDTVGRLVLLASGVGAIGYGFWRFVLVPWRHQMTREQIARHVELCMPDLNNSLINTIQLARSREEWKTPELVDGAIAEAVVGARKFDLMKAVDSTRAKRLALIALVAWALLGGYAGLMWPRFSSAAMQLLSPFSFVPSRTNVRILSVEPGNAKWPKGEPMQILMTISDPGGREHEASLWIHEKGVPQPELHLLKPLDGTMNQFAYLVPAVRKPLRYWFKVGGTESEFYNVVLRVKPTITRIDILYEYPAYTGLKPKLARKVSGGVQALVGTMAELRIHTSVPVAGAALLFDGGGDKKCLLDKTRTILRGRFKVLRDGRYKIQIRDISGSEEKSRVGYHIRALPDKPPAISFSIPGEDVNRAPGETVKLVMKATDDFGLAMLTLYRQKGDAAPKPVAKWRAFKTPKAVEQAFILRIDAKQFREGDVLTYYAEVVDGRTYQGGDTPKQPNRSRSMKYKVFIQNKQKAAKDRLEGMNRLFERLSELLVLQRVARKQTVEVEKMTRLAGIRAAGQGIGRTQVKIRGGTLEVAQTAKFDEQTLPIKQMLFLLAQNEMAGAIGKSELLGTVARANERKGITAALKKDQDAIIASLEKILDLIPMIVNSAKKEMGDRPASDLPPEAQAKLKDLRDRLKEFIDEQKKVIEASEDITKKPVDNFTEEDGRKLEELAAVEDKWEKFINEAISDLSKIPEIDASNPTLARELVEVKTDLEMAKDALKKKVLEIIVPLEELGRENAEEIVENLERWLMDEPDRIKWSQEEPVGDAEIPNAELPEQLEDIIGDLFEEEEDLFEDAEDITSSWADSIDKGAGWDTMDGPISNFSAKGVTGNQLPNTSEISGRSGEVRTGKASGEMVEEAATGKGGR
ncbi:MAG: hypothetical protein QGD94_02495, partial [Planctomycetia bacterium]|nr:hypothetical protein [Planctomycetia bacterium]